MEQGRQTFITKIKTRITSFGSYFQSQLCSSFAEKKPGNKPLPYERDFFFFFWWGKGGYKTVLSVEKNPWEALISSPVLLLFKCKGAVRCIFWRGKFMQVSSCSSLPFTFDSKPELSGCTGGIQMQAWVPLKPQRGDLGSSNNPSSSVSGCWSWEIID